MGGCLHPYGVNRVVSHVNKERRSPAARWREDEMKRIEALLVYGATQLEITVLPSNWRIVSLLPLL
jgi:hypothetical protein